MAARKSSLSQLLGPAGARRFLSAAWPDEHFVVHRKLKELPDLFRLPPLSSFDALAQLYQGRVQIAGGRGEDHLQFSVSAAPPQHLRRIGLTVFFGDDVSPYADGAPEFLRGLEEELGAPRGIGAIRTFASPPGGGLEPHYDQGETFIVQLEGRKEIRLAKNQRYPLLQFIPGKPPADDHFPEFTEGFPKSAPADEHVVTLKPGSVLFIPRGMWHRTQSEGAQASYSASICVDTPAAVDVLLESLRPHLRQSERWRRPLYGAWGQRRREAARELTALLAELGRSLPRLSAEGLLDAQGQPSPEDKPLRDASRFQRVPSTELGFGRGRKADRLIVRGYGGDEVEIQLNPALRRASEWLKRRKSAFSFAELTAASPDSERAHLETLVRNLVVTDALRWLTFEPIPS